MVGWPLMPSPRFELRTLAGYRLNKWSDRSCWSLRHVGTSARRHMVCACSGSRSLVPHRGGPVRSQAIRQHFDELRAIGRGFSPSASDSPSLRYSTAAPYAIRLPTTLCRRNWQRLWKWRVASAVPYRHNVWRYSWELARTARYMRRVASVTFSTNSSTLLT
jgi:hypothetical protein